MKNVRALFSSAVIYALISGCAHLPAIPPPGQPITDKVPQIEASVIDLPVKVSLATITAHIDKAVPRGEDHDRGDDDWVIVSNIQGDVGYRYYWERTPIALNMNGNAINASTEVHYRQRGGLRSFVGWKTVCCGCGSEWPRVLKLNLSTTLDLRDDWRIEPHTVASPMRAAGGCASTELSFAAKRISNIVQDLLNNTAVNIDNGLRTALNPRAQAESAWEAIQNPIPMPDGASLLLQPQAVQISPLSGRGNELEFRVGLVARPRIVRGSVPAIKARPLPGPSAAAPGDNFHIALEEEIPFDLATGQLFGGLKGRMFVMGDKKVYIEKVRLYGSGDSAVMEVGIKVLGQWGTPLKTTIYLTGEPAYDAAARAIFIRRLDYTPETKDALAKADGWLLDERLRKSLADHARWYIGGKIDDERVKLERALNRDLNPHVRLSFSVQSMRPLSAGITATSLKAVIVSNGTAALTVR